MPDPSLCTDVGHSSDVGGRTLALVHSRLDYANGVLVGLPAYLMRQLQSVLNAAARLIYRLRTCDHITDALISLHWLRVPQRIQYRLAVLTYRVLHRHAPQYTSVDLSVSIISLLDEHCTTIRYDTVD